MRANIALLNIVFIASLCLLWFPREKEPRKHYWMLVPYALLGCAFFTTTYAGENAAWGNVTNICALLFMPYAWLYMRMVCLSYRVGREDLPHMLPAILYAINYGWAGHGIGNVPHNAITPATYMYAMVATYLLLQLGTALTQLKTVCPMASQKHFNYFRWLVLGCMAQYVFSNPWASIGSTAAGANLPLVPVAGSSVIVAMAAILNRKRHEAASKTVVAGESSGQQPIEDEIKVPEKTTKAPVPPSPSQQGIVLLEHQLVNIEKKVSAVMQEKKQFLMPRYTIRMLSEEVGISLHILSAYINRKYGMHFNDFINEYRVKYCLEKIKNNE